MAEYHIYVDRDNHAWMRQGDKIHAYEKLDEILTSTLELSNKPDCAIQSIMDHRKLELLAEGTDLKTTVTEAKLALLLR